VELLKQFEPAHSRQIGVDQQACGLVGMKGVKKRLAACMGVDDAAVVFEHGAYRLTNLVVIIDDDDPGSARSAQGVRPVKRRCGEWLGRLGQELLDRARQLAQFDWLVEMNTVVKGDIAQGLGGNIASENDDWNLPIELLPQFLTDLNPPTIPGRRGRRRAGRRDRSRPRRLQSARWHERRAPYSRAREFNRKSKGSRAPCRACGFESRNA